ncbi:sterol desaturase family protein [Mycobacterium paragordonae]|uniref:Sterol desaturase family protein n=1 Tax=Mycobacterium paragordonae TaxID=1389713 RepID=A0AAJ1SC35_9MYCO|nr:sterol desaturase family protein [Mycobacterium paragordonae]MDP7737919.1 sterol desaturase family protein [Mycobacterium paragordonae]
MSGRLLTAGMLVLHGAELIVLIFAARVTAGLYAQSGLGGRLPTLLVVAAVLLVGWQTFGLVRGQKSLTVAGLAVQAAMLIAGIAVATQDLEAGSIGIALPTAILAGWGCLARTAREPAGPVRGTRSPALDSDRPILTTGQVDESWRPPPQPAEQNKTAKFALLAATIAVVLAALSAHGGIVFGLVILAVIFVPLERLFPLHPRRVLRQGWRTDLVHYLVNGAALKVGLIAAVIVSGGLLRALVPPPLRVAIASTPSWVQIVAGLAIAAVGDYAGHRAAHEIPLLWRFHRVHHSVREMDWLAANHLHPVDETFIRSAAVLPLYALGFGQVSLGAFVVLISLQAVFIHANVNLNLGPLRWLTATPQFHHWHHARDPRAHNSNFAGEFPLLDAIFGTLYLPAHSWPTHYGLDETEPTGYLRQLAWPLTAGLRHKTLRPAIPASLGS